MERMRRGAVAVIFVNRRTEADEEGYAAAAGAMAAAAAAQPGFLGIDSIRDAAGEGITISWWADEAAAIAWRDDAAHAAVRDTGRARWYDRYALAVATVTRSYGWTSPAADRIPD